MNVCDEHSSNVLLFLDNELTGEELEDFRAHLATCDICKAQLAEEQALSDLLHRSRPLYSAPDELRARLPAVPQTPDHLLHRLARLVGISLGTTSPLVPLRAFATVLVVVAGVFIALGLNRHAHAAAYVDKALTVHRSYVDGALPLEVHSDSPEVVTAWFAGKVPFNFRLPAPQSLPNAQPAYKQVGARLISFRGNQAALVTYAMKNDQISLLVASKAIAPSFGGEEIRSGALSFHYHVRDGFNIITWSNHGLTYALVSSVHSSARQSCLVCHENMSDKNNFQEQ